MGHLREPPPSLLTVACFSRHLEALAWADERLTVAYGPLALVSPDFPFHHTTYYEASMGTGLVKRFLTFVNLVPPDCLPDCKHFTNALEQELAHASRWVEPRPLNLDPGLVQLGKFLLASTKDQGHRIYLGDGIFAEVTLRFEAGAFDVWPWTYSDYREPEVRAFLNEAREYLHDRIKASSPGSQNRAEANLPPGSAIQGYNVGNARPNPAS